MAVNRLPLITAIILYLPVTDASQLPLCVEIKIFDISHPFVVNQYVFLLDDPPLVYYDDLIRISDGAQAVGNRDQRLILCQLLDGR